MMKTKFWTAAAVILAISGAAFAGEMSGSGGSANPASEKGVKTPQQPNESQPGMSAGTGDRKGGSEKGMKGEKGKGSAKGAMKDDATGGGSGMKAGSGSSSGMSGGSSNMGNPADAKGSKTPSQPNETQPGMGSNKK
jgi:hypothetical protein